MIYKLRNISGAIWEYLNQSITPNSQKHSVWKFDHFFYLYKIKLLEACWYSDSFVPNHESRGQDEYRAEN